MKNFVQHNPIKKMKASAIVNHGTNKGTIIFKSSDLKSRTTDTNLVDKLVSAFKLILNIAPPPPGNHSDDDRKMKVWEDAQRRLNEQSPIQQQMQNSTGKYFKQLQKFEIDEHNRHVRSTMTMQDYSSLFDAIINNDVRRTDDLQSIHEHARAEILSTVADIDTLNKLINTCHSIAKQANGMNSLISRLQYIHSKLSQVF